MTTPINGDFAKARLGNLYFGGIVAQKVTTKDFKTQLDKHIYVIELPCGLFIETETLN